MDYLGHRIRTSTGIRSAFSLAFLTAGLLAIPLYLWVREGLAETLMYDGVVLASALAVAAGTYLNRPERKAPWVLFSIAMFSFLTGVIIAGFEGSGSDATAGGAGLSDLFSLLGYVLLITALVVLVRSRTNRRDQTGLVDALIVVTAAATLTWVFLIAPTIGTGENLDMTSKVIGAVYPAMNLTLLTMLLRLAFSAGPKPPSYWILMAAVLSSLAASQWHLVALLTDTYHPGHVLEIGWLLAYIGAGGAALHPSMRRLAEPVAQTEERLSRPRVIMFGVVALLGPMALLIQKIRGETLHPTPVIAGTMVLFFLILVRVWGLLSHLHRSEQRFRSMVQNSSDGTAITDPDGRIIYVTDAVERILGHSADNIIGRLGFDLLDERDVSVAEQALSAVLSTPGNDVVIEARAKTRQGTKKWLECHFMNLMDDPAVQGIVCNFRDISERKAREQEVLAAQDSYRNLFDNALEGMYESTGGGRFIRANTAVARILGYDSAKELLAVEDLRIHWVDPERRMVFLDELVQHGTVSDFELQARRKDGTEIWASITATALSNMPDGEMRIQGMVKDITARKQAEEANELLRQAQKMEAVGKLAGGIAHDFNNLLSVIINYARFALEELDEDTQVHGDIQEVHAAGERGARLVRQLLAFSRNDEIALEPLDVFSVVTYLNGLLVRTIGEDIALQVEGAPGFTTLADRGQLEQVVMNLVVNARDAMPQGGRITITAGSEWLGEMRADRGGIAPGEYVTLSVQDTGSGMTEEVASRAFEPFYTTKQEGKGTGLGLSSVYGIIEQMNGRITLETVLGSGTCFTIYLPVARDVVAATEVRPQTGEMKSGAGSILVCEDEKAVREMVRRILERGGFKVLCAESPMEAVEMIERNPHHPPRLLLTDVVMPGMSGAELAEIVKENQPDVRIAFMSGYADEVLGNQGVTTLGPNFLPKPFTEEELLELVNSLMVQAG